MYTTAILIALVLGLVEAIKRASKLDKSFLPLLSVVLGIGIAFLAQGSFDMTILETILFGIVVGLSSCGLFDFSARGLQLIKRK